MLSKKYGAVRANAVDMANRGGGCPFGLAALPQRLRKRTPANDIERYGGCPSYTRFLDRRMDWV